MTGVKYTCSSVCGVSSDHTCVFVCVCVCLPHFWRQGGRTDSMMGNPTGSFVREPDNMNTYYTKESIKSRTDTNIIVDVGSVFPFFSFVPLLHKEKESPDVPF